MEKLLRDPDEVRKLLTDTYVEGAEVVADGRITEVVLYLRREKHRYRIAIHALDSALGIVLEE